MSLRVSYGCLLVAGAAAATCGYEAMTGGVAWPAGSLSLAALAASFGGVFALLDEALG